MANSLFMRIMASSLRIVNYSGKIIRDIMEAGELGIIDKGVNDLQTKADRSVQQCIIASLTHLYPNVKIIGEEGATDINNIPKEWIITDLDSEFLNNNKCPSILETVAAEDLVIWVDPLDGTNEYTQGFLDRVTVLIGISWRNQAYGGVIHQPYFNAGGVNNKLLGRTMWGIKGLGCGGFIPKTPSSDKFIITTTRTHSDETVEKALSSLSPTEILRVGGAGYKVLQLLEGRAHSYIFASAGCKKWDTCAPEAILEAHGGILTDMLGRHYQYHGDVEHKNKSGVLATAKGVSHQDILEKLPENIKKVFM